MTGMELLPKVQDCFRPIITFLFAYPIFFSTAPGWHKEAAVGKTVVSSSMIDRVTAAIRQETL